MSDHRPVHLVAVLASPPTTSGTRTYNAVRVAGQVLGATAVSVVNLFPTPAPDLPALASAGADQEPWLAARRDLGSGLARADEVLMAWGLPCLTGSARRHWVQQLAWVTATARGHGHEAVWSVNGEPRHPSRWHQYVSDRHGRCPAGTFPERLRDVLVHGPWPPV